MRVIAATNKPLEEEQKAGRFREDLFYRLNVVSIDLPPLREQREDIAELVAHLLTTRQLGSQRSTIAREAISAMSGYSWPGNVRELVNVLERAQILAENNEITLDDPAQCASGNTPFRRMPANWSTSGMPHDPRGAGPGQRKQG